MRLRNLVQDDDAVSPVIGVILMVAITVILAAVIASFVLGLGGSTGNVAPQANFEFNYDSGNSEVTVTHTGGDAVRGDELFMRGNSELATTGTWASQTSGGFSMSGSAEGVTAVVSGDSGTVDVNGGSSPDAYILRMIWQDTGSDSSAELAVNRGPDA